MYLSIITLLVLDIIWISSYMSPRYKKMITKIQNKPLKMNYISALVAYGCMIFLLVNYVIKYNFSLLESFLFGVCLYAVYDFTAGAVFTEWDFKLAIMDILWGGTVYMIASYVHHLT